MEPAEDRRPPSTGAVGGPWLRNHEACTHTAATPASKRPVHVLCACGSPVLTTRPQPASSIPGRAALVAWKGAFKMTAMIWKGRQRSTTLRHELKQHAGHHGILGSSR
jgi:hypothetical protein